MDIYTIIFLALAVFIFLRLRNVLGQRTGNERPPYDRAARNVVQGAQDNKVVPIPGAVIDQAPLAPTAEAPPSDRWKGLAEPGTALAQGLDAIAAHDPSFDPRHFLSGARSAYEMIVQAFANGDRRALKDLLSPEVYESFEAVIRDREKHEQKTETRFVSIDKAELVGAEARDRSAQLTVRFVSQMVSVTRDWPSARPSRVMTCACMSVGKPGNGLVITSAGWGRSGPRTLGAPAQSSITSSARSGIPSATTGTSPTG